MGVGDRREWMATERGWNLLHMMLTGGNRRYTVSEIAKMLGYADCSGASKMLSRNNLPGLVHDPETNTYWLEIEWPY